MIEHLNTQCIFSNGKKQLSNAAIIQMQITLIKNIELIQDGIWVIDDKPEPTPDEIDAINNSKQWVINLEGMK